MNAREVTELKDKIEAAKGDRDEAQGSLKTLLKQLMADYGCKTVKEAQKKLKELRIKLEHIDSEIEDKMDELEEALSDD